jgi:O-antigen ligase
LKWVALAAFLMLIPLLVVWLKGRPRSEPLLWMLLGLLPFISPALKLIVAPVSWAGWPGYTRGLEVSLIDSLSLAILFAYAGAKQSVRLPFLGVWLFFLFANLLSAFFSDRFEPPVFAAWQIARVALLFAAIATISAKPGAPRAILTGMVIGVMINAVASVNQRFLGGAIQAAGLFSHQNALGMATHFAFYPLLFGVLYGRRRWFDIAGLVACTLVVILGASRGTIGLVGIGCGLVVLAAVIRRPNARTMGIAAAGALAILAAYPLATISLNFRFQQTGQVARGFEFDDQRLAFIRAADNMFTDYPMGVGANMYVSTSILKGYAERAGVNWSAGNRSAYVHNGYLVARTEMGYVGLAAFILLLFWPVFFCLRRLNQYRSDPRADMMIGYGISVLVVAVHSIVEWVFFSTQVLWLHAICLGMISGLAAQLARDHAMARRQARERADAPDQETGGALPA